MAERYHFLYSPDSTYGRAVTMLRDTAIEGGLILDLGCGYGAAAEPLTEAGFSYVGFDADDDGLKSLDERGFETHTVDLTSADLTQQLEGIVGDRAISGLLLLDIIEHLPDPAVLLNQIHDIACTHRPTLVLSVPNVAHFDVGAKLMFGRWDTTPSGLLDHTHLRFFTLKGLEGLLSGSGWTQIDAHDVQLTFSDQHFPVDHPALSPGASLGTHLRHLRRQVDGTGDVNQFVRAYVPCTPSEPLAEPTSDDPFLSVLVRTQGDREPHLIEALTCLAAQTDDDLEVLLLVHSAESRVTAAVKAMVDEFSPTFTSRVRLITVEDGGRGTPLNVGLDVARGRYVAFLDDDDLVTANWAEQFRGGTNADPGMVIRSVGADRQARRTPNGIAPYEPVGSIRLPFPKTFNAVEHLYGNGTPICTYAIPRALIDAFTLRFNEDIAVVEDWDFLMRAGLLAGVHDTGVPTSIYHRWEGSMGSLGTVAHSVWDDAREKVLDALDREPLLLPPGAATQIVDYQQRLHDLGSEINDLRAALHAAERQPELDDVKHQLARTAEELEQNRQAAAAAQRAYDEIRTSRAWRATALPRRVIHWLKYR